MYAINCKVSDLEQALLDINNDIYKGNAEFKRFPEQRGKRYTFTLKVKDSNKLGARRHYSAYRYKPRKSRSACWHLHGHFFEALFAIKPDAEILSGSNRITKDYGNWKDRNIGSQIYPVMFSQSCEC
jgi:hypothetical protein